MLRAGGVEVLAGVNLPVLVKLASVRNRPIAEAVRIAQEAGRKYITGYPRDAQAAALDLKIKASEVVRDYRAEHP